MVSIYERYSTIPYAVYMRYYAVHTSYATYSVSSMEMSRIMDRIMDRIGHQSTRGSVTDHESSVRALYEPLRAEG